MSLTWNKLRASERRIESALPLSVHGPLGVHIVYTASGSHLPNTLLLIFGDPTNFNYPRFNNVDMYDLSLALFDLDIITAHVRVTAPPKQTSAQSRSVGNNAAALGQAVSAYL
jgi:hypothetical protein